MDEEQKQNSPWLKFHTGLAFGVVFGVVFGGSLTLAFAPAFPVAVGVIATTTILWGAIGYLTEEYQKDNLKNDNLKNGYNIPSPSSSRRFSKEAGESFATPPNSPKGSLKTVSELSALETESELSSQRDEEEIHHGSSPIARRALFLSPSPNSPNDSVNFVVITPFGGSNWDETIFNTPPNIPQASSLPMTQERRSASPSPSKTKSRSPIYVSTAPSNSTITADLVLVPPNSLATNSTRPEYCIDTPRLGEVSLTRIKAINDAIERKNEGKEKDPFSKMKLAAEEGNPGLVMAEWRLMAASTVNQPKQH
jgi:hypothetical protein